jgi:hypothetical protein
MNQHLLPLFAHRPSDQTMRRVAMCGVVKRKRPMLAVARQIRRELGMPLAPALNSFRPIAWKKGIRP